MLLRCRPFEKIKAAGLKINRERSDLSACCTMFVVIVYAAVGILTF